MIDHESTAAFCNFVSDSRALLSEVVARHRLTLVEVSASEVALVGEGFGLVLSEDFDDVAVTYLMRDRAGRPVAHEIGTWIGSRFTPADRARYGSPVGRAAHVCAALRVIAAGLAGRFDDLLSGDTEWLQREQRRDPDAWSGRDGSRYESLLS